MKVPPYSLEAEKSVLGSILINKDAILKISDFLAPEDFYHDTHAILYRAMMDLYDRRIPVDVVTLTSYLEDRNQLDKMGGVTFIAELSTEQFTAAHILQYAMIVKEKSTLRRLIKAGDEIMALGYDETVPLEELLEQSEKALFHVSQNFIKDRFVHVKDILAQTFEKISDLHDSDAKNKYRGIPTGFADLDMMLSGLQGTDLLILAGRPSMGKTSLALNMAQNIARQGK
ncbi:MAG: DnaB-like helicase N-terminal domain-containing protein, partial [Patescibacteria group bacterium]